MKPTDTILAPFLNEIRRFLAPTQITTETGELAHYGQDWSNVLSANPSAILFPTTTAEVSQILKAASTHSIAIVPSGGRTGLSGGAVASLGEVVLSLTKLNFIGPLHKGALTLRMGAGAITQAVHEYCQPEGLTWPVDFASKGSSCVGGNIATNAGGVRVLRYGNTRNWVLGLTAVTMDGTVHQFNGELEKNSPGYDFRQLMIGSEGTLAVITEATLKLCPLPRSKLVFFFAVQDFSSVIQLFSFARTRIPNLSAFECLDRACLDTVVSHFGKKSPFDNSGEAANAKAYVLVEVESNEDEARLFAQAESWLAEIFETGFVLDGVMAQNEREVAAIWQLREGVAESILSGHVVHQEDVSVPIASLEKFYSTIHARYAEVLPKYKVFFFGHIGDGNLHIFVQKPAAVSAVDFIRETKAADLELFKVLETFRGSVSAEHGIGVLKKHALHFTRSNAEMMLLRNLKKVFDPKGLLNPGKIFD